MSIEFPPLFILSTNLPASELHSLEERIDNLTWDPTEAEIIVGKITRRERALFELRRLKITTDEIRTNDDQTSKGNQKSDGEERPPKRRRTVECEGAVEHVNGSCDGEGGDAAGPGIIKVVKLEWLTNSLIEGTPLPLGNYLLYQGQRASEPRPAGKPSRSPNPAFGSQTRHARAGSQRPALLHETTSEHDVQLPPVPDFLHNTYSCERPTPVDTPNAEFIEQLKEVRKLRLLQGDQIGVRAYSTSIAALAAYPHAVQSSFGKAPPPLAYTYTSVTNNHSEVSRLPGCGTKIAQVWQQWKETGHLNEVVEGHKDAKLSVLKQFYDIWGVGDTTARDLYAKGYRDLDDLIEFSWNSLSRVQQIGVKYYDEFKLKIPRLEVEEIANVILSHARKIDDGFQMTIVGGYRRGKADSGDVDVILSHPDESQTLNFVEKMVRALEKSRYITHTLTMSTKNSERGQTPLPWKGEGGRGSGFDTLDKALVVWQDPARGNAPHRRVDIIVSPWKTVGCAVLGWSGGTTFQRDIRRYCKAKKNLKFDSSGVRNRGHGHWVDLEGADPNSSTAKPAADMETAERRVFDGLGLQWRPPNERCTG